MEKILNNDYKIKNIANCKTKVKILTKNFM